MSEGFSHIPVYSDHSPNFIGVWSFENHKFCDDIIEFFEHNPTMHSDVGFVDYKDEKRKVKYEKKFEICYFLRIFELVNYKNELCIYNICVELNLNEFSFSIFKD